ncbi:hypothetical protein PGTUg99_033167 [Puccinia graminis f. sp. tritici]|uniref:hAT-like transposase RNase-H fold domain-containing protein n=1 Tax=Puccinia graminis f. sp. tritici TaxID=56615 RepID=A0A5B0SKN4_PUCGR|nr:hypothetical protein PGTUg99_033167 [Puccinia graminis f. sp. tritici]
MHVRCFCHKLALIVNTGLKELSLKTLPPGKSKESILGFFPVLGPVTEELEPEESVHLVETQSKDNPNAPSHLNEDTLDFESYYSNEGKDISDEEESVSSDAKDQMSAKGPTSAVKLKSLDVVIKQLTRLAAERSNFKCTANQLKLKVSPLIAGYGIRWNIRYQSYQKAIDARAVIDHILKEDQENQAGLFGDVFFTPRDWKEIDSLNLELEVFVKLTSQMEGDLPTGTHFILKYLELKDSLTEKVNRSLETDTLYPMYNAMLKRVNQYLDEAMQCDTLLMAIMMQLFELVFGPDSTEVTQSYNSGSKPDLTRPEAPCIWAGFGQHFAIFAPTRPAPRIWRGGFGHHFLTRTRPIWNLSYNLLNREFQRTKALQKKINDSKIINDPDITLVDKPANPSGAGQLLMSRLASRMAILPTAQDNEVKAYLRGKNLLHQSRDTG